MYNNPLYWEHGVFLQPQHFQLSQLHALRRDQATHALLNPYLWGIRRSAVNTAALSNGLFEIVSLELLLPTGDWVFFPENALLPTRSFADAWTNQDMPLTVYLAIAEYREQGHNAVREDAEGNAAELYRYVAPSDPDEVVDLLGDGVSVQVPTMRYNLKLLFEGEDVRGRWTIPVARLVHDGERVRVDSDFASPCVDINAFPVLQRVVRTVRDTFVLRSHQMSEYKIPPGNADGTTNIGSQELTLFTILGLLSRNAPELDLLLQLPCVHPLTAYALLCRLVGELSVFSQHYSALGENIFGERVLPIYSHENPAPCFITAADIISRIVDSLVSGPAYNFVLETVQPGILGTVIPKSVFSEHLTCWLLLRSSEQTGLSDKVLTMGKLAAPDAIRDIVARALPGVRLTYREQPPVGLPRRNDTAYFAVDGSDRLWHQVQREGRIAFMLPGSPDDLIAQIVFV